MQVHRWNCEACGRGYDLGAIESALVAVVQHQEQAYQLQDLQCTKCKNVRLCNNVITDCHSVASVQFYTLRSPPQSNHWCCRQE